MQSPVLIVGAGPSGLVLALSLLRNGIPVRIIERDIKYGIGQRGCGIQPRTLEMHKFLGILPAVQDLARLSPKIQLRSSPEGAEPVKSLELNIVLENTPLYPYINPVILGQDRHEAILRSAIQEYGCKVELGAELKSLEQNSDQVTAHIFHQNGVVEIADFKWLVGADGGHSVVRKQLDLAFLGETRASETSFVVGDIRMKKGSGKYWNFWGNSFVHKMLSLRPCETEDDQYNFMLGGVDLDHRKIVSSREEIIDAIYQVSGREDMEFGDLIWMGIWRPNIRMVNTFRVGRVFLVGDAAHVHPPSGGQGMNSGVQDSVNLAWKLALVQKGYSSMDLLESYTQERLPVIASMLNLTTDIYDKMIRSGSDGRGLVPDFGLRQFGVNYRQSHIIVDERCSENEGIIDPYRSGDDGAVRGGDRAPDAPELVSFKGSTTSLFDIFKPTHHTVLIFPNNTEDHISILHALTAYPQGTIQTVILYPQSTSYSNTPGLAGFMLEDKGGYAFKHYNVVAGHRTIFVVRPDGYIGAVVGGLGGMTSYFKAIFAQMKSID